jgi:uncharacterized protein YggE
MRSFRRALTLAFALFLLAPATASAATVTMNGGTMEISAMETAPQTLTVSGEGDRHRHADGR